MVLGRARIWKSASHHVIFDGSGPPEALLELLSFRDLAWQEKRFEIASFAAQLERSEILVPEAFRNIRFRLNPQAELVQVIEADLTVAHAIDKMIADRGRQS
jgi:hypothetical protein